jgi:peroxiredoxin
MMASSIFPCREAFLMYLPIRFLARPLAVLGLCLGLASAPSILPAQSAGTPLSPAEKAIVPKIHTLRTVPDAQRGQRTTEIALQIRALPVSPNKLRLAVGLAGLSTEGDFGHDTLQAVATTLETALSETPIPDKDGKPAYPYMELAKLARYEHVTTGLQAPQLAEAAALLESQEAEIQKIDFTLTDLSGRQWTLKDLRGKVVLVTFWATWCPPCRKEMPDLQALYDHFASKGFVVLAISDEESAKVVPFISERKISYPVLLDPGRKVTESFHVDGIPKSFVFDRDGKLVALSIDMRTQGQFRRMLAQAGLQD